MSLERHRNAKRVRRTGDEVRARLLQAGLEVFAERGYAGASTKEISRRAKVAEVLLFRHFGNKDGLFEEAVLAPFQQFVDAYLSKWEEHRQVAEQPLEDRVREYVDLLYRFFEQNRQLFDALLAARAHRPAVASRLDELFARLQKRTFEATIVFGLPMRNPALTTRLSFGLVMSAALHADMLFPSPSHADQTREQVVDQLCGYMLEGAQSETETG
ncbi:hypothetical protein A5692_09905 [Mycobacterium sp. E342]|uniref:TetR/AcrR family transcriptional regulator n=1 Tax=unclassified Mycobacterium TaxID=2642494 RepID=UPI0008009993|nr:MULTISPECIES: TetR/AcrR family transcriptional regulator [unclassified Mycobacterium]OBH11759.1 hypothetical protein A9X04_18330 [Mycobacterium sp. E3247]OBH37725.1 hypothetical protein A5692_09905 [Mycobacterium sp. E342]